MPKLLALFTLCFFLFTSSDAEAKRKKKSKRSDVPAALKHSKAKQKQQNRAANKYKLERIKNRDELRKRIAATDAHRLVLVTDTTFYYLDPNIGVHDPGNEKLYHYTCTWVKDFLDAELLEIHNKIGVKFKITSLTRTRWYQWKLHEYQKKIRKRRGKGSVAIVGKQWWQQSSHSTCSTVDISFSGLGSAGKREMRKTLENLQTKNDGIAVEERGSGHFHVMVLPTYK